MCTAATLKTRDFYFGRTLDYEHSHGEQVTITPRNFPLSFRHMGTLTSHYAIIGMAYVAGDYPLYFDAINEKGVGMAGLNFVGNAKYSAFRDGMDNICSFEFIPWILSQCESVAEAKSLLNKINLTGDAFSSQLPPSQLHWIIADRNEAITVESTVTGLHIYENPVGVLTNNPEFGEQLFNLNNYMHLSPNDPENLFSSKLDLNRYSRGMGAIGLPGDLSSQSRFVRVAFTKMNARCPEGEGESIAQFFHILGTVAQTDGCCHVGNGQYERTIYTSCCNCDQGIYYYTTYHNNQITGVCMHNENLDSSGLIIYPLLTTQNICIQNG